VIDQATCDELARLDSELHAAHELIEQLLAKLALTTAVADSALYLFDPKFTHVARQTKHEQLRQWVDRYRASLEQPDKTVREMPLDGVTL
jgi:hypothetical protein